MIINMINGRLNQKASQVRINRSDTYDKIMVICLFNESLRFLKKIPFILCYNSCVYNYQVKQNTFPNNFIMCFLKHIQTSAPLRSLPTESYHHEKVDSDTEINPDSQLFSIFTKKEEFFPQPKPDFFLLNFFNLMNFNSQMMITLDQKLEESQQALSQTEQMLSCKTSKNIENPVQNMTKIEQKIPQKVEQKQHQTNDSLTSKLFGNHHYRYRLALSETFSDTLYKERNFGFGVKLIDIASGKEKTNGNLVNICLAVCDSQGEWIHQTKEGTSFIKGKVETELYHGEGEFIKLSPKDVSRSFPNKMINLVVYPKPTLLKYSGESSLEENIDFEQIEPLVIRDVSVKAKKRE